MERADMNQQGGTYIGLLAASTILSSAMPMLIIMGGLAGMALAPSPALATLPPAVQMVAALMTAGPFSLFMGRFGRRAGFVVAGCLAIFGGMVGAGALFTDSFVLLCLAHMALGAALAGYQYFRFAAAEVVPVQWQPVAISLMLTSGLVAAFIGPQVFIWTSDALAPVPLAGAYAALSVLSLVGIVPLFFLRIETTPLAPRSAVRGNDLALLTHPPVFMAIALGATAMGVMVFVMSPTPLAMIGCGFSEAVAGDVIRWHVVAMFAPSFFTGFIIKRLGALPVARIGLVLLIVSAIIAASGLSGSHFYLSLIVLGVGWNFAFIAATTMLASAVSPEDRAFVQGANDTIIALAAAICAFASGAIVTGPGWTVLALVSLPVVAVVLMGTFAGRFSRVL